MQHVSYGNLIKKIGTMLLLMHYAAVGAQTDIFSVIQDKRLSDITLLCAHNATSNYSKGPSAVADQTLTLTELLQEGIRAFKIPIHIGIFWDIDIEEIGSFFHLPIISIKNRERAVVAHALAPSDAITQEKIIFDTISQSPAIQALEKIPGLNQLFNKVFHDIISRADDIGVTLSKLSWPIDRSALPLEEFLITLRVFLERNPKELIVITPNINIAETKDFDYIIQAFETSGITPYLYLHNTEKPWPTIKEFTDSSKRFICLFQHADEHAVNIAKYYGPNHWISRVASMSLLTINTQYAYSTIEEFATKECCIFGASCGITGKTPHLMNMQHFITKGLAGDQRIAQEANKPAVIWQHIKNCSAATGLLPNFIMLDFLTPESIKQINQEVIKPLNTRRTDYKNTLIPQSGTIAPCTHCTN